MLQKPPPGRGRSAGYSGVRLWRTPNRATLRRLHERDRAAPLSRPEVSVTGCIPSVASPSASSWIASPSASQTELDHYICFKKLNTYCRQLYFFTSSKAGLRSNRSRTSTSAPSELPNGGAFSDSVSTRYRRRPRGENHRSVDQKPQVTADRGR
jgi:hypothetical protein